MRIEVNKTAKHLRTDYDDFTYCSSEKKKRKNGHKRDKRVEGDLYLFNKIMCTVKSLSLDITLEITQGLCSKSKSVNEVSDYKTTTKIFKTNLPKSQYH